MSLINSIEGIYSIVFTYLSIASGFSMTAFALISSSQYSRRLYRIQSRDNSKTMLHILVGRVRSAVIFFVFLMATIIGGSVIPWSEAMSIWRAVYNLGVLLMTLASFVLFARQVTAIAKFVIQSAKIDADETDHLT